MKTYKVRVRHFRELAGYSKKELADFLAVTKNTIDNYENERTKPSMRIVVKLAHILNTTTDELLGIDTPDGQY